MKSWFHRFITYCSPTLTMHSTATVRYAFSMVLLLAMAVGTATVLSSRDTSRIFLRAPSTPVVTDVLFSVDVIAYAHKPVNALSVSIAFPADLIEVVGIDKGESVITLWTKEPSVSGNTVYLEGGTYRKGFIGEHKIATLNVRAKTVGAVEFLTTSAELVSGDGSGAAVATNYTETRKVLVVDATQTANNNGALSSDVAVFVVTDIDNDGSVSLTDIKAFMAGWGSTEQRYDFNNDGKTSMRDFSIILAHYFRQ